MARPQDLLSDPRLREEIRHLRPSRALWLDRLLTVDEYYQLVDEDSNVELVDGVIIMPSPTTIPHEELFGWLHRVLGSYTEVRQIGRVYGSRTAVRIGLRTAREPDVLFVRHEHMDRLREQEIVGPPDLVIEIVDSIRARREALVDQAQYEELGVPELWMIDLPRRALRVFDLGSEGLYIERGVDPEGEAEVRAMPGLRLQVAWLWQGPDFPPAFSVVQELLGR
ncbi:MAG: Uma2 family endonuclease [Armatimonadetes bacterium]|nr:Uma2 family endonuclease [Armatimonadota bacterium]